MQLSSKEALSLTEKYGVKNYKPLPVVISKAKGVWVEDPEGNRYMDMLSAYSAVSQGHCHPKIIAALKEQADRVTLVSRAFNDDRLGQFYEKLAQITNKPRILPMNTGTEAVESAIKAVRRWAYRHKKVPPHQAEIIVCENNFHGRTTTVISFSSEEFYRDDYGPYTPGFKIIPYGDINALREAITPNTAAFLFEPIQGEAGIRIPPEGFLREAAQLCSENDVLMVADEIQTGFGRCGRMFGCDLEDVVPDLYLLGKALSGGVSPVSAVAGSAEVLDVFEPGSHGSTFGGNALAAAVGIAALEVIEEDNLVERSRTMGKRFMDELATVKHPELKEVRGRGLLVGMELNVDARPYCERLMEAGILAKETHVNVIRFAPPLVINDEELDWALERIKKVMSA